MSLDSLTLTAIAMFVIFAGFQQLFLNRNISIYNLAVLGLIVSFTLVILYQHFRSIFIPLIGASNFFGNLLLQNPKFIISCITNSALFFGLVFAFLYFKLIWFSSRYDHFFREQLYENAARVAERRLKFLYRFYGNHFLTGSASVGLASFYLELGQREKAKSLFLEAFNVFKKDSFLSSKGKSALEVRVKLSLKLSEFYLLEEDYTKAETYCSEVIKLSGSKGVSDIFIAQARQIVALVHGVKGNSNKLISESAKAREIYQSWVKREQRFQSIQEKIQSVNGWFAKQTPILIVTIALLPPIFFSFFRTQGYLIFIICLFALSQLIDSLLNRFIKQNSEKQESIVQYCSLIEQEGNFYESLGDYELAEEKYGEVLHRLSTLHENSLSKELVRAKNYLNQGSLQMTRGILELASLDKKQGYYEDSISYYDEALRIYNSINSYSNIFIPAKYRNEHVACLLQRYLTYARLVGIETSEHEVIQAFSDAEKILIRPNTSYASQLIALGFIYYWAGRYPDAEEQYSKAESILAQQSGSSFYERLNLDFAQVFLNVVNGQARKALERIRQSNEIANTLLLQCLSVVSERHKLCALQNNQIYFNCYATLVYKFFLKSPSEVGALFDFILRRKAIGAEALTTQRDVFLEAQFPPEKLKELELKLENLTKKRREIAHKMLGDTSSNDVTALQKLNRDREILEEELAREIPELNLEKKLKNVNRHLVSQALPAGSVLIEIVTVSFVEFSATPHQAQDETLGSVHYLAFVLQAGQPDSFRLINLGSVETIDHLIARYRAQITGDSYNSSVNSSSDRPFSVPHSVKISKSFANDAQTSDIGIALRTKIFDPLASAIGKRKRIFISPDGNLTQIPFEILPLDGSRRLIDLYSISYLSAGRDILRFEFNSAQRPTVALVIADPDFDYALNSTSPPSPDATELNAKQSRHLDLSKINCNRLKGMREEGRGVADLLNAQIWLGNRALKANLFKSVHSPLILHIATHGFFLPNQKQDFKNEQLLDNTAQITSSRLENPLLRSGLALAGANWKSKGFTPHPDAGNGILTAEEVSSLNLSATELVALSACETGRGETLAGEGVFGLRRAFVLAGAKTLIMSLWQVPDEQTKELMVSFYNRLLSGESRSEALRNSQLEIREKHSEPYFWGAFVCQGHPGSIPDIHRTNPRLSPSTSQTRLFG